MAERRIAKFIPDDDNTPDSRPTPIWDDLGYDLPEHRRNMPGACFLYPDPVKERRPYSGSGNYNLSLNERKRLFIYILPQVRGVITEAARFAGVHPTTVYSWREDDSQFNSAVEIMLAVSKETRLDLAENCLFEAMDNGDTSSAKYYLDRQGKGRGYGATRKLEHQYPDGPGTVIQQNTLNVHMPPPPKDLADWESQTQVARQKRKELAEKNPTNTLDLSKPPTVQELGEMEEEDIVAENVIDIEDDVNMEGRQQ